jgi:hypothetical protein
VSAQGGWFGGVELPAGQASYDVTSRVVELADTDVISRNLLRAASVDYPADVSARYTSVPAGAIGVDASDLLTTILQAARPTNPYDLAVAIESYLKDDDNFTYTTNVTDVDCSDLSAVECFARHRRGYCLHYASTMAMLLRAANPDNPIPTRLVQGFLPGTRSGDTEVVRNLNAHAWVEVYFPGYGWVRFDPTGGGVGRPSVIQEGPPVASATPGPSSSGERDIPDPTRAVDGEIAGPNTTNPNSSNRPGDRTLLIVVTLLLGLLVVGIALVAWLRGPRGEITPDRAWLTMSGAASRLGFAPRANQTIYEYASSLGELVPVARSDLQTVADAKVETSYARVRLGGDRLQAVRDATRRLRLSLLRLVLHRGWRRRR